MYSLDKYKDLWFYWNEKPLILGDCTLLNSGSETDNKILNFFSFKKVDPSYNGDVSLGKTDDYWGWLNIYPQIGFGKKTDDGRPEQMTVGVAQNCTKRGKLSAMNNPEGVMGRSYTSNSDYSYTYNYAGKNIVVDSSIENSMYYGLNFQEQWDYAIEKDPDFVFVTGWNEWVASRFNEWNGTQNAFPDQFSPENSRDIEPSKGVLKDYYYYQLCENIRRYKGVTKTSSDTNYKASIDINGYASQWNKVTSFNHYAASTWERNTQGYLRTSYKNDATRNDIITSKVAYDKKNIYFYVETLNTLTPSTDNCWMRLFLDTDTTGLSENWEGFEYILNRVNPTSTTCTLERAAVGTNETFEGWTWESVGEVSYTVKDNILQVSIPRSLLGMDKETPSFNFKWIDNMQTDGEILDFYTYGEAAPGGRFTYSFNKQVSDSKILMYIIIGSGAMLLIAAGIIVGKTVTKKKKK